MRSSNVKLHHASYIIVLTKVDLTPSLVQTITNHVNKSWHQVRPLTVAALIHILSASLALAAHHHQVTSVTSLTCVTSVTSVTCVTSVNSVKSVDSVHSVTCVTSVTSVTNVTSC